MAKHSYVNFNLYNTKQSGVIIKKDINRLSKSYDLVSSDDIEFYVDTFINDDGKKIERLFIKGIIYADRIIEDDDMDKTKIKKPTGTDGTTTIEDPTLALILESINNLRDDMNKRFVEMETKFDKKLLRLEKRLEKRLDKKFDKKLENKLETFKVEIINHITDEFKKHIKEYH